MNNLARGAGADAHGYWSSWRTCEREPRTVTTGMEETNSLLSMWLQLGRACQAFVFVAGDLAISPESAQHQRGKARGRERRVVKAAWVSGSRVKVSLSRRMGLVREVWIHR